MNNRVKGAELKDFQIRIERDWNKHQSDLKQFIAYSQRISLKKQENRGTLYAQGLCGLKVREHGLRGLVSALSSMRKQIVLNFKAGQLNISEAESIKAATEKLLRGIRIGDSQNLENDVKDFDVKTARLKAVTDWLQPVIGIMPGLIVALSVFQAPEVVEISLPFAFVVGCCVISVVLGLRSGRKDKVNEEIKRHVTIAHRAKEIAKWLFRSSGFGESWELSDGDVPLNLDRLDNFDLRIAADVDKLTKGIYHLSSASLDTPENIKLLTAHATDADKLAKGLYVLRRANWRLITPENIKLLTTHAAYADKLAEGLIHLNHADPQLDTPENINFLTTHAADADKLAKGLYYLRQANLRLDTPENIELLTTHAAYAHKLYQWFRQLWSTQENFNLLIPHADKLIIGIYWLGYITPENIKLLTTHAAYADKLGKGLYVLRRPARRLDTPENIELLTTHAAYADKLAEGLYYLRQADPQLDTPENIELLTTHAAYADNLGQGLMLLNWAYPRLDTPENIELLTTHAAYADKLAEGLKHLSRANPRLDTPENIELLTTHAAYADKLAEGLKHLSRANPRLDTEDNFNLLIAHAAYADKLAKGLCELSYANPRLDTPENIELLTTHAADADKLGQGLKLLNWADPRLDTPENIGILIQYSDFIDKFLILISSQDDFNRIKNGIDNEIKEQRLAFLISTYRRRSPDSKIYHDENKPDVIRFFKPRLEPTKDLAKKIFDYLPSPALKRIKPKA